MTSISTNVQHSTSDDHDTTTTAIFVTINNVGLVGTLSPFGIASNGITILVFFRQGFSETTNISYVALAFSDMLSLVASLCLSIFWNPLFLNSGLPIIFVDIQAAFASLPYGCFSRISGCLIAFITFERCLCVVWPLKIKRIISKTVIINVVVSINLIMFLIMVPIYSTFLLGWISEPQTNRTLLGAMIARHNSLVSNMSYSLNAAIQFFAFFAVVVCTAVLTLRLRQKARWRIMLTAAPNGTQNATRRQEKAIKMATFIATIYVVCYLPTIMFLALPVLQPGFNPNGYYRNIFFTVWSFATVCGVLNSSVNLFVYHHMSSKFKHTCDEMFNKLHACPSCTEKNIAKALK